MEKKMERRIRERLMRIIILLVGLTIAHFGVTLFLLADLGADPFNVLVQGLYRFLARMSGMQFLTHGRVHITICFIIIVVLLVVDRAYIKIGTILCMICGGPIIDFFQWILAPVFQNGQPFAVMIIVNCIGCGILAFGMTIVIKSDAGTGPNDLVALVISEKCHRK
ncbi:MAG: hypothetical protein PHE06_06200, partial [Lachnospiraceae bacterium]|nr:hypothetical protein [Lachnospiraceae bacterium]